MISCYSLRIALQLLFKAEVIYSDSRRSSKTYLIHQEIKKFGAEKKRARNALMHKLAVEYQ